MRHYRADAVTRLETPERPVYTLLEAMERAWLRFPGRSKEGLDLRLDAEGALVEGRVPGEPGLEPHMRQEHRFDQTAFAHGTHGTIHGGSVDDLPF